MWWWRSSAPRPRLPHARSYAADATTGRGINIVDSFSLTWGARPTPDGRVVWALVDSASLLWRAHLDDSWLGEVPIDEVLSVVDEQLLSNPPTLFVAMHAAVALAARGDAVGLRLLGRRAAIDSRPAYRELVVPLAAAMAALVDQRPDRAAQILLRLTRSSGSAAARHNERSSS